MITEETKWHRSPKKKHYAICMLYFLMERLSKALIPCCLFMKIVGSPKLQRSLGCLEYMD